MFRVILVASITLSVIVGAVPLYRNAPSEQEDVVEFSNSNKYQDNVFMRFRNLPERLIDFDSDEQLESQESVSAIDSEDDIFYKFASLPSWQMEKVSKNHNGF